MLAGTGGKQIEKYLIKYGRHMKDIVVPGGILLQFLIVIPVFKDIFTEAQIHSS